MKSMLEHMSCIFKDYLRAFKKLGKHDETYINMINNEAFLYSKKTEKNQKKKIAPLFVTNA